METDETMRCKKCKSVVTKLLLVPVKGEVVEMCKDCKWNYMVNHNLTIEDIEWALASIRKGKVATVTTPI